MWKEQEEPTITNLIIFNHRFGCFFSFALGNSPFLSGYNLGGTVSQECCPPLAGLGTGLQEGQTHVLHMDTEWIDKG